MRGTFERVARVCFETRTQLDIPAYAPSVRQEASMFQTIVAEIVVCMVALAANVLLIG